MHKLPFARNNDVIQQSLSSELLIYDLRANRAFCLNKTSAIVYFACDGQTYFDELKQKHDFTDELIFFALEQLEEYELIEGKSPVSPFAGMSRREVIRKVGLASLIALPLISSITAPTAAMAQSGTCGNLGEKVIGTADPGNAVEACKNGTALCCSGKQMGLFSNCNAGDVDPCKCEVTCA